MARIYNKVSGDTIAAIKQYCYTNVSQFFKRHEEEIDLSRSTFFRLMGGHNSTSKNVLIMEQLAEKMGIKKAMDDGWMERQKLVNRLFKYLDDIMERPDMANLARLKTYLEKNRIRILGSIT